MCVRPRVSVGWRRWVRSTRARDTRTHARASSSSRRRRIIRARGAAGAGDMFKSGAGDAAGAGPSEVDLGSSPSWRYVDDDARRRDIVFDDDWMTTVDRERKPRGDSRWMTAGDARVRAMMRARTRA